MIVKLRVAVFTLMTLLPANVFAESVPASIVGSPVEVFGPAYYPPEALRNAEQGRAVVDIEVAPSGQPNGCTLLVSSGSSSLDATTCRQALTLRFKPARNISGDPIVGHVTLPVRWVLPTVSSASVPVTVSARGGNPVCAVQWRGTPRTMQPQLCRQLDAAIQKNGVPSALITVEITEDQLSPE